MFQFEYEEIQKKPLNVEYLMMDSKMLLPPAGTPLTGKLPLVYYRPDQPALVARGTLVLVVSRSSPTCSVFLTMWKIILEFEYDRNATKVIPNTNIYKKNFFSTSNSFILKFLRSPGSTENSQLQSK